MENIEIGLNDSWGVNEMREYTKEVGSALSSLGEYT